MGWWHSTGHSMQVNCWGDCLLGLMHSMFLHHVQVPLPDMRRSWELGEICSLALEYFSSVCWLLNNFLCKATGTDMLKALQLPAASSWLRPTVQSYLHSPSDKTLGRHSWSNVVTVSSRGAWQPCCMHFAMSCSSRQRRSGRQWADVEYYAVQLQCEPPRLVAGTRANLQVTGILF
jgi:hypothetical protein